MIKKLYNYRIVLFSYVILILTSFLASYFIDNKILNKRISYTLYSDFAFNYQFFDDVNILFVNLRAIAWATQNEGIRDFIFRMQDNIPASTGQFVNELNNDSSVYSVNMGKYFYEDFPNFGENIKIWGRLFPRPNSASSLEVDNKVGEKIPHIVVQVPIQNPSSEKKVLNIIYSSAVDLVEKRVIKMINEIETFIRMFKTINTDVDSDFALVPAYLAKQELMDFLEKFNKLKIIEFYYNNILENNDTSIFAILPVLTFMIWSAILLIYRLIYEYRKKYFT